jgi:hypothetical protein
MHRSTCLGCVDLNEALLEQRGPVIVAHCRSDAHDSILPADKCVSFTAKGLLVLLNGKCHFHKGLVGFPVYGIFVVKKKHIGQMNVQESTWNIYLYGSNHTAVTIACTC